MANLGDNSAKPKELTLAELQEVVGHINQRLEGLQGLLLEHQHLANGKVGMPISTQKPQPEEGAEKGLDKKD